MAWHALGSTLAERGLAEIALNIPRQNKKSSSTARHPSAPQESYSAFKKLANYDLIVCDIMLHFLMPSSHHAFVEDKADMKNDDQIEDATYLRLSDYDLSICSESVCKAPVMSKNKIKSQALQKCKLS